MRTFVFCSFKGGTAKTSSALHVAACLARYHAKRVLLVDFDSQANLSTGLGIGPDSLDTLVPVLQGQKKAREVIHPTCIPHLDLIPANTFLDGIETHAPLVSDLYAHERLRKALSGLDYDFCFIDTPPSLGWLTQSAFYTDSGGGASIGTYANSPTAPPANGLIVSGSVGIGTSTITAGNKVQITASTDLLSITTAGNIVPGSAALATNATDGFTYLETCAGTPTGVPTSFSGRSPQVYDTTDNILYTYNGGWQGVYARLFTTVDSWTYNYCGGL